MHAAGARNHRARAKGKTKLHCHSAASSPVSAERRYARPPCKTTFTLAGATLPPVILAQIAAGSDDPCDRAVSRVRDRRPANHTASPETPPPVHLV